MKTRCLFLLLAGLLLLALPVESRLDPRLTWRTLETEHFLVLFHEGCEGIAARAATIAEQAHADLAPELRWQPTGKTRLVLADVADAANGWTTPLPFNRIVVYLTPPLEQPFSITDREEWLRIVIVHEYAHILHLDNVQRLPKVLRYLFGRFYFPNAWQPAWLIEGLATYEETRLSSGGRGRSSYADMLLRMALLEKRFPTLAQAGNFPDSWPSGDVPYIFGVKFYQYLVDKYGPGLPGDFSRAYAGRPLPFMVDSTARDVFDSTFRKEWQLWQRELRLDAEQTRLTIEKAGLSALTPLTRSGDENLFPVPSPDGTRLAWSAASADRVPSLLVAAADGSAPQVLLRRLVMPSGAAHAWLPDSSGLLYAKLEADRYDNLRSDLYRFDLASGRETRLTDGLRAASPDLDRSGVTIVCTVAEPGRSRLALLDADGGNLRFLSAADDRRDYYSPRWSPDGSRIVAGVKTSTGAFTLLVLDRAGSTLATLDDGGAQNSAPTWSPDGRTVFFSSDRGGIYNIHAWRPETGALFRVSNVLGGLFCPAPASDGRSLYVTSYSAAGFDLALLELDPEKWSPLADTPAPAASAAPAAATPGLATELGNYWPFFDLLPRYWIPWWGEDEDGLQLGLLSSGTDAPGRHQWAATLLYGLDSQRPAYSALYQYDGLLPTVQTFASDQTQLYADFYRLPNGAEQDFWEQRRSFGLDLIFPGEGLWSRHFVAVGGRYQRFTGRAAPPAGLPEPERGDLSGVRLAWLFGNPVKPARAISLEDGRQLQLAAEHNFKGPGDFRLTRYTLDWQEFLDLPWQRHHVLATRLFGGYANGDVLAQRAFQLGGDTPGDLLAGIDQELLPLRGYPVNALRGQRALLASLEYRFPLVNLEGGVGNGPFFFRRLHGAVFAEAGDAFDHGGVDLGDCRSAAGAEGRLDLDLGYRLPLTLRLVLAKGFDHEGEEQAYMGLWFRF